MPTRTRTIDDLDRFNGSLVQLNNNVILSSFTSVAPRTATFQDDDGDFLFEAPPENGTLGGAEILSATSGTASAGITLLGITISASSPVNVNVYETTDGTFVEYPDGDRAALLNGLLSNITNPLLRPLLGNNPLQFLEQNALLTFNLGNDVAIPVCFGADTGIATRSGEIMAGNLRPGDEIITRDHGYQKLRWVGARTVRAIGAFAPIRFAAGSINNTEAMVLSPEHRVLISGREAELLFGEPEVFVAAKHLVGLPGVKRKTGGLIRYVHFMFERHEIVFANGTCCESFYPGDIALNACEQNQREEIFSLFPELRGNVDINYTIARRSLKRFEAKALRQMAW
ncbi:hypothetical protein PARPLA_00495 [Rhodobacteraceae bacterium THAF1]|uniref:Hint domain-containing protein n=1 Tax=Palleronia sp. THAF1 TaxID=2587842 RepID=UPI000F3E1976|nr:Hint domain-containing protein [Palleronia sp. THAF1]QFU09942.1 hypothetical protein FIU81_14785 [Palleronia sp. THAF1]VDC17155.1 hypothetical protein PARPLA_00495 [Rhodobacteraceae bacterium THAF1]